jgi:hypothetical protein
LIDKRPEIKDQKKLILALQQCTSVLLQLASRPEGWLEKSNGVTKPYYHFLTASNFLGLSMILQFFIEGAIKTKFAKLFGGKHVAPKQPPKALSLYEENLKFG